MRRAVQLQIIDFYGVKSRDHRIARSAIQTQTLAQTNLHVRPKHGAVSCTGVRDMNQNNSQARLASHAVQQRGERHLL